MMRSMSVVGWPKHCQLMVLGLLLVGLMATEADAARRGRLGRFRRRGCPSGNCAVTSVPRTISNGPNESIPDEPPPPPDQPSANESSTSPDAAGDLENSESPLRSPSDLPPTTQWRSLFDGETLTGWESTPFGGEGEVFAEDGSIILKMGQSLTGVNYKGEVPRSNYEVELEAKRVEGTDFFCGFTFPVKDSYCSFIVGGWAGGIVGLSCIDGMDASENETTKYMAFETDRWYKMRVRVTDDVIQAWIDDENVVYQNIQGRKLDTRIEVDRSQPFGFATYETTGALRNIRIRELSSDELATNE